MENIASDSPVKKTEKAIRDQAIANDVLLEIVRFGIMAPSGDNVQPWRFAIGEDCITLFINRGADDSFFNVQQVASLIACGAALQNMVYMAEVKGLEATVELFPYGEGRDEVAHIHFAMSGKPQNESIEKAILNRCTNRRMFSTSQIDKGIWEKMVATTSQEADTFLLYNEEKAWRRPLAHTVYLADMVRVARQDLHEYLMKILHFKAIPKDKRGQEVVPDEFRTGMPLKNLQAGLMGDIYMRSMRKWSVMRVARYFGAGLAMPLFGAMSVVMSGGIGLVCVRSFSETTIVRAGRAIERVWCELEREGYALQPLAALPLLTLRTHLEGEAAFKPSDIKKLKKAKAIADHHLHIPADAIPVFMFRAGRSAQVTQRTYRQRTAQLLVSSEEA
ncbi:hypothetical protein M2137_001709 [Parabacteroides sp. PFB2-10]|uniref:hypothetical protein n=1 Tax=Parabacteroides sp. PFB2-10 TaxID=1742405 RepID=UPI002474854F|nr:hypothetical protein [Parabacteroides sp. PFB2-10]MDH6312924.1 hypothetical protein [Parabacteroides sp. PFB2-10]